MFNSISDRDCALPSVMTSDRPDRHHVLARTTQQHIENFQKDSWHFMNDCWLPYFCCHLRQQWYTHVVSEDCVYCTCVSAKVHAPVKQANSQPYFTVIVGHLETFYRHKHRRSVPDVRHYRLLQFISEVNFHVQCMCQILCLQVCSNRYILIDSQ